MCIPFAVSYSKDKTLEDPTFQHVYGLLPVFLYL